MSFALSSARKTESGVCRALPHNREKRTLFSGLFTTDDKQERSTEEPRGSFSIAVGRGCSPALRSQRARKKSKQFPRLFVSLLLLGVSSTAGHCKSLKPEWEKSASALKGVVGIAAVDATESQALASKYGIQVRVFFFLFFL